MIDRALLEMSVAIGVAVVALAAIPVPRPKPPIPVEVPAPPPPVPSPVVAMPGSLDSPRKSEEGGMPLQVEPRETHVTIQQLLTKLDRIEKKLTEVQKADERAGQPNTN